LASAPARASDPRARAPPHPLVRCAFRRPPRRAAAKALDDAQAAGADLPPLLAAPFVVADHLETSTGVTSAGLGFLDEWEAGVDAPVVLAAQAAGGLLVGKANIAELGFAATGVNAVFGTARNVRHPTRRAGRPNPRRPYPARPLRQPRGRPRETAPPRRAHAPPMTGPSLFFLKCPPSPQPYKRACIAGSGVASAVAARMAVFGIGVDGRGGSTVRVPAALCGVVAFRPTRGRLPGGGSLTISPSSDSVSVVTRSVGDAWLVDRALTGAASTSAHDSVPAGTPLAGVVLARPTGPVWDDVDDDVAAELGRAIERLEAAGVVFVDVEVDPSAVAGVGGGPLPEGAVVGSDAAGTSALIGASLDAREAVASVSEYFWERGAATSIIDLVTAVQTQPAQSRLYRQLRGDREGYATREAAASALCHGREALRAALAASLEAAGASALVWPACRSVACTVDAAEDPDAAAELEERLQSNASVASNGGLCSVVLPCGAAGSGPGRLPVALEVALPEGRDDELLMLALGLERALPAMPAPRGM